MLVRTGRGSISLVAGCCWVNSVHQSPPGRHHDTNDSPLSTVLINTNQVGLLSSEADPGDSQPHEL
ncbi:MAG: hypothetical protein RLZZ516_1119 [Cyanobacteriota bacterium]|jgi:hypothetical protein